MGKKSNRYSSHKCALEAAAAGPRPIRRVLELGGGLYSTSYFLDRALFPELECLITFEPDPYWQTQISRYHDDPRFHPVQRVEWGRARPDLVFIDNGVEIPDRVETIRTIGRRAFSPAGDNPFYNALVVIHDFEQAPYQHAAAGWWPHQVIGLQCQPATGFLGKTEAWAAWFAYLVETGKGQWQWLEQ